jgi:hypothetical protein
VPLLASQLAQWVNYPYPKELGFNHPEGRAFGNKISTNQKNAFLSDVSEASSLCPPRKSKASRLPIRRFAGAG